MQHQVVRDHQPIVADELGFITQFLERPFVLPVEAVVHDLPPLAERMRPRVHERLVFQMLEFAAFDRIDHEDRARDPAARVIDDLRRMLQERLRGRRNIVHQRVRPERVVIHMQLGELRDDGVEHLGIPHPPGDLVEVDRLDVLLVEELEHLLVRAVL